MRWILKDSTDQSVVIRIVDSTDGTPEQAVEHNSSGISLWYRREGGSVTAITPAALAAANSAHADGGIEHLDDGYYRLDLPDAAVATGANGVMVGGAVDGMVVIGTYVALTNINPYDGVRAGLTALPNAAADAAGGLPISDAGGLDLDAQRADVAAILVDTGTTLDGRIPAALVGGRMDANVGAISTDATAADNLEAILDGTGGTGLTLSTLSVTAGATIANAGGSALTLSSSGSNGHGLVASGNGTGQGCRFVGGATGDGLRSLGGGTGGSGAHFAAQTSGYGIEFAGAGSDGHGILTNGAGTGAGIWTAGGADGDGIHALGGSSTGDGIHAEADTDGYGLQLIGAGTAANGLQTNTIVVSGATTLTGAVTATNASNDIRGAVLRSNGLANVTTWTVDVTGNITGNLSGSVGSVTGNVGGSVATVAANGITASSIATDAIDADALKTDAVTEIVSAVLAGTITELSAIPAASPSLKEALALLYMALRNKIDITSTAKEIHNDAGTVLATKSLSDDGVTYSEAKMA